MHLEKIFCEGESTSYPAYNAFTDKHEVAPLVSEKGCLPGLHLYNPQNPGESYTQAPFYLIDSDGQRLKSLAGKNIIHVRHPWVNLKEETVEYNGQSYHLELVYPHVIYPDSDSEDEREVKSPDDRKSRKMQQISSKANKAGGKLLLNASPSSPES